MDAAKRRELQEAEDRLSALHQSRDVLQEALAAADAEVSAAYQSRSRISSDYLKKKDALESLQAKLPPSDADRDRELEDIKRRQAELESLRADRDGQTREYAKVLDQARQTMETLKERLTEAFHYYAGEFLAEECTLNWEPAKWRLGEEGELLSFPQFTVQMTSALSHATGSPRRDQHQVSESQKEFIDLAFRMALFDAVREDGERAMLVIETPEASLDAVFVDQAGHLLRKFALQDGNARNVVIATTNLNRENMLRSLLGLDEPGETSGKGEARQRVINLLAEAAPNAAMRKYRREYEKSFEDAMKPGG
jgi:hypothetical protein